MNLKNILISDKKTIKDAMKKITKSKIKTLIVIEKNKELIGSLTDGDIRRYLSIHNKLNAKINVAANKKPKFIYENDLKDTKKRKKIKRNYEIIPILDQFNRVVDIIENSKLNSLPDYIENKYNVIIFAGGKGKRLMPLTRNTPKPMLKIDNAPILEKNIMRLKSMGFKKYYISVNYISHKIKKYFKDGKNFGVKIKYIEELKELGTAGPLSLLSLEPEEIKHPLLVLNGDIITKLNFKRLISFHKKNRADLTIATREFSSQIPYGVLHSKNNRLLSIKEKPINNFQVNAGIYAINPKILELLKHDKKIDMPEFINKVLTKKKKIMCYTVNDYWKDIGSPRDLDIAKSEYVSIFSHEK